MINAMKTIYTWLEKILIPLIVLAVASMFTMYSRLNATELKQVGLEQKIEEMSIDILAVRCAVTKDEVTCLKLRMKQQ